MKIVGVTPRFDIPWMRWVAVQIDYEGYKTSSTVIKVDDARDEVTALELLYEMAIQGVYEAPPFLKTRLESILRVYQAIAENLDFNPGMYSTQNPYEEPVKEDFIIIR